MELVYERCCTVPEPITPEGAHLDGAVLSSIHLNRALWRPFHEQPEQTVGMPHLPLI